MALLGFDSAGRSKEREKRIQKPLAEGAEAIEEIDSLRVKRAVKFLQIQISAFKEK